ncbi:hypothetical protein B5V00_00935 [Geothermobacter hydrogeniphilus]|uniref:Uncharacterized protein n=1 Tax=Geothermobacter hydrogeniphilus TaxID=1969733 RepID=A0A1X0YE49_9BACT|nr:hypothetical protein B5V00_00935 [Geothermobacter hydrogeniphilus]
MIVGQADSPEELFDFPCDFQFKAFGETACEESFCREVLQAVSRVIPVDREALCSRTSSGGRYVCATITVRVSSRGQMEAIYAELRTLEGLRYLL